MFISIISLFSGLILGLTHGLVVVKKQTSLFQKTDQKQSFINVLINFSFRYFLLLLLLVFFLFTLKVTLLIFLPSYFVMFWVIILLYAKGTL